MVPYRNIAWAGIEDGTILGLGGIAFMPDGSRMAFTELTDAARKRPLALHKAALACMDYARRTGIRELIACADMASSPNAERWLSRLGFKLEVVRGFPVWKWKNGRD